ncbi:MAG: alpha/beta fold hydrolase [Candidatus Viridilinea halotolerans]|uniref:Alpha/beta fold hydrolase n=1 Tax=Candidatus Viridilinea halotolerans TaxID=2491704 RepID=A0A426U8D2_9CHLR|nr:MAG: alpha/beta fold hydrolase [Candidatus Viridilinea halotolerans]
MAIRSTTTATTSAPSAERRYRVNQNFVSGSYGPIRYWASEPRQGVPIVFIHGYGALIEHWRPIMRRIAREHTFYALDLYGFGYSARPAGLASRERWAAQVATFITKVVGGPAVVVGHSMGGVAVSELARSRPELVRGLVLVNSSGMQIYERPVTPTDRVLLNLIGTPLVGEAVANIIATEWGVRQALLAAYHHKERVTPELVETFLGPLQRFGSQSYLNTTRNAENLVIKMEAGEYPGPALIIWGTEDRSLPPTDANAIKRRALPQAEIKLLDDCGHCPFDEAPDVFADVLLRWVNGLPQT